MISWIKQSGKLKNFSTCLIKAHSSLSNAFSMSILIIILWNFWVLVLSTYCRASWPNIIWTEALREGRKIACSELIISCKSCLSLRARILVEFINSIAQANRTIVMNGFCVRFFRYKRNEGFVEFFKWITSSKKRNNNIT